MDHKRSFNRLCRKADERRALINGLLTDLFRYQRIKTTLSKAKALKRHADKMVTQAKKGNLHNRRNVLKRIHSKEIVSNLFDSIAPRFSDREGGYTRIFKLQTRLGDNAKMAIIELVDIPDSKEIEKIRKTKKRPFSKIAKKPAYPGKDNKKKKKEAKK